MQKNIIRDPLGGIYLVNGFIESEIAFDSVSQLSALKTSTSAINSDDDVLEPTCNVVMPISIEREVNHLA